VTGGRVAALSLAATCLFFYEYLPPLKRVHFAYDIHGYHYPLLDYAFRALSAGRFPEWEPAMYCGLSFVGNVQAALFYPPNWLLFAVNWGRERMSFLSLEVLVILHFWLALFLCWLWLRGRRLGGLACVLGAAVFAYSGYMVSQVEHVGVVTGYAWLPLGLWGIDRAAETGGRRALGRTVAASALSFLAGYPPAWFAFGVSVVVYGAMRRRPWAAAVAWLAALPLAAVQLLPAIEAASLKAAEIKYQGGVYGGKLYLSYFLPNFFDVGRQAIGDTDPTRQYFYLGAPALFALGWAARRGALRPHLAALAIAAASLILFANPLGVVEALVIRSRWLSEICRDWNFLAGFTLAAALLTGVAVDDFLRRPAAPAPRWLSTAAVAVLLAWSLRLWIGHACAAGWAGAWETATTLAALTWGLSLWRGQAVLALALLLAAGVDYKVHGTGKLFNADAGRVDPVPASLPHLDDATFREIRSRPEYRLALQWTGPHPTDLRLYDLPSPQGFDPLLPAQYKQAVEAYTPFRTDRTFDIDPANEELVQLLSVRWFLTDRGGPLYGPLSAHPAYRLLPSQSFFQVFEYTRAVPTYRWDGEVERLAWSPEVREFRLRSAAGGRFVLGEQFFPGWRATIDGVAAPIERWRGAFQAIQVGGGERRVRFEFRSPGLRLGAVISLVSLLGALCVFRRWGGAPGSPGGAR